MALASLSHGTCLRIMRHQFAAYQAVVREIARLLTIYAAAIAVRFWPMFCSWRAASHGHPA